MTVLGLVHVQLPEVSLINQSRRLQSLPRVLLGQPRRRQLAKLVVHQRQKLLRGVRFALLDRAQETGNIGHEAEDNRPNEERQPGRRFAGVCSQRRLVICRQRLGARDRRRPVPGLSPMSRDFKKIPREVLGFLTAFTTLPCYSLSRLARRFPRAAGARADAMGAARGRSIKLLSFGEW